MAFDHEQLDVYRLAIEFVARTGELLDSSLKRSGLSAARHLDDASQSIVNNSAEGNGKRSRADRCHFLDIARGSALERAAVPRRTCCKKAVVRGGQEHGKVLLERIVSMPWRMVEVFQSPSSPKATSPSASTSTSTRR